MRQDPIPDPAVPVSYRTAVLLVLAASLLNSAAGVFVRSVDSASELQIVFYRSASLFVALTLMFVVQHGAKALRVLRPNLKWSLLGGLFHGLASSGLVVSMTHTTIANTTFVLGAIPFITACLAWVFLGESVRRGKSSPTGQAAAARNVASSALSQSNAPKQSLASSMWGSAAKASPQSMMPARRPPAT